MKRVYISILQKYFQATHPRNGSFRTLFAASALGKGNLFFATIIGAGLFSMALLIADTWLEAWLKLLVWVIFFLGLCALSARIGTVFNVLERDEHVRTPAERAVLGVLNFLLVSVWAFSLLEPKVALAVSFFHSLFIYAIFAPSAEEAQHKPCTNVEQF